jgi:hypothetical protein
MVYSDAALPGLWGIRSLPKVEMTIVAALDRDVSISYPRLPVEDLRAGTTVGADPWK